jgi:phosphoglycerate dehydrogenase-like enzyme
MSGPVVFVYRPVDATRASHAQLERAGCRLIVAAEGQDPTAGILGCPRVDVLLGATFPGGRIERELLLAHSTLRLVAKYTIGVDDVDIDAATDLGILVTHSPTEANWGGVAEGTVAILLGLLKQLRERDAQVRSGGWRQPRLEGIYLGARADGYAGIRFGMLGLGRIGRRVARLLAPWRIELLACDPYVDDAVFVEHDVRRVDFDSLLEQADVLSLHCNLTAETKEIIDTAAFGKLKSGAAIINTARGSLVDLDALCDALTSERLAAAALDVFPVEPLPADARIRSYADRVLLSPHMVAANRGGTLLPAIPWATDAALAALRGEVPAHVYNESGVARWRERFGGQSLLQGALGGLEA